MTFRPEDYLKEALDLIETAEINLQNLKYKGAVNRAYYAVFNCVQALILSEGLFVKTHSGLKNKFSEFFVKSGKCSIELSKRYDLLFTEGYLLITTLMLKYRVKTLRNLSPSQRNFIPLHNPISKSNSCS